MAHLTRPAVISGVSAGSFPETGVVFRSVALNLRTECNFRTNLHS